MQGRWLVLGLFFSCCSLWAKADLASVEVNTLNSEEVLKVTEIVCGEVGADLDVILKDAKDKPSLKITLNNYRTVLANADIAKPLKFEINHPSVGNVELSNGTNARWNIRPSVATPQTPSVCTVEIAQGNTLPQLNVNCANLIPETKMITVNERLEKRLTSVKVAFACPSLIPNKN